LSIVHKLRTEGRFTEFGLSNFRAADVVRVISLCDKNKWNRPTVYQGMYNGIARGVEGELMAMCRAHGIRFYAFNPLAGGLLTGKYSLTEAPLPGRFTSKSTGPMYRRRYWHPAMRGAAVQLARACEAGGRAWGPGMGAGHGSQGKPFRAPWVRHAATPCALCSIPLFDDDAPFNADPLL